MFLKKKYGQHLLYDSGYIHKMVLLASSECRLDSVFEIGPGTGYLTKELLPVAGRVTAVEIDRDFSRSLEKLSSLYPGKFEVFYDDILKCDIGQLLTSSAKWTVFANIPYYITSPIVELLLNNRHFFTKIFLTIQKEVAQRLCAPEGSRERSAFSFFAQYYAECSLLFDIPAASFDPPPKVDSSFISMHIRETPPAKLNFEELRPIIGAAFKQRRKTLKNALSSFGGSAKIESVIEAAGVDPKSRPETLSLRDFEAIAVEIKKLGLSR